MKILILSYTYHPAVGGIETVSSILANDLTERGHEVAVITDTPANEPETHRNIRVIRRPGWIHLRRWIYWAHVVLQNNISLTLAWPLYVWLRRTPYMLVHQTPIASPDGRLTLRHRVKLLALGRAECFSVSGYLARTIKTPSRVLPNPYASEIFVRRPDRGHGKDILFVGRLVYAKGVDTLLRALVILRDQRAEHPRLTIVGGGPEEAELKGLTTTLGLDGQVTFVGSRSQNEVAAIMNEHILVVVPSRPHPPEAFGIVAVEAIACGCVVLASNCGGLPEAVGSCGMLFETENPESLAACLSPILSDAALRERFTSQAPNHLAEFDRVRVVDAYERHLTAIATTAGAR